MSGRFLGFKSSQAGFCRRTCRRRHLPSAFEMAFGPLGPEDLSWEKYAFQQIQRQLALLKPLSGYGRNSDFWRTGCFIRQTWIHWISLSYAFCRQKSRLRLTQIWQLCVHHCQGMGSASGGLCMQNMTLIPLPLRKIIFEFNRWLAYSPTHFNKKKYFSGLEEVLIRH